LSQFSRFCFSLTCLSLVVPDPGVLSPYTARWQELRDPVSSDGTSSARNKTRSAFPATQRKAAAAARSFNGARNKSGARDSVENVPSPLPAAPKRSGSSGKENSSSVRERWLPPQPSVPKTEVFISEVLSGAAVQPKRTLRTGLAAAKELPAGAAFAAEQQPRLSRSSRSGKAVSAAASARAAKKPPLKLVAVP
jgi:hypothetical protein